MIKQETRNIFIVVIFLFITTASYLISAPKDFSNKHFIKIENGKNLSEISALLKDEKIIRFEWIFSGAVIFIGGQTDIKSGDYFFNEPVSVFVVIKRLLAGDFGIKPMRITIPEGSTVKDIANLFSDFENFDKDEFFTLAKSLEGYLFPDTYFFLPNVGANDVIEKMKNNFVKKIGEIKYDDLIMASLIEKEVANEDDRRIVSGILWKRLKSGMLLQVDAVFHYINGENLSRVTFSVLEKDSPYNTYLYKGLPPTPICNPGLDAVNAALNPRESSYWFYLSDRDGNTYFSKNFEEHKLNKEKYLR